MIKKPRRSLNEALFVIIDGKLMDKSYLKLRHIPHTNDFLSLDAVVVYEEP
jgi:hypothetical protein